MCLRKWYESVKLKNFFNSCSNINSISQFCVNFCHFTRCQGRKDVEDVIYQQWISTDRTKLTTITESKEDFMDNFSSQLSFVSSTHHLLHFPLGCTASASLTMLKYLDYVKSGNVNFSSIITANIVNSLLLH